jgi:spoIIIJ-associated protein
MLSDKEIKKNAEELFNNAGFVVDANVSMSENDERKTITIAIEAEEPDELIGLDGKILFDIQYILKLILKKKMAEYFYLDLDINDYKKKKSDYIKKQTATTADEVSLSKAEKELPPMSPYERRVAHLVLSGRKDVVAESEGSEPYRRIIIRPCL